MDTYFIRHKSKLDVDKPTLTALWEQNCVGIHYPQDIHGSFPECDATSIDPSDYEGHGKSSLKSLQRLSRKGGYVFAVYRGFDGAKIGFVKPGTPITLFRGNWRTRQGREAVMKVVQMERSINLSANASLSLLTVQPQQGTICRWHKVETRVASMLEGVVESVVGSLTPDLQEVMCMEFLREPAAVDHGLPQLKYTLAPVGRTMRDVDVFGMTADDRIIAAQVTFQSLEKARYKLRKLDAYVDGTAHTVLFCQCDAPQQVGKHLVFPLSEVFKEFCLQNEQGKRWFEKIANHA